MRRSLFVGMVLALLGGALANAEEIVQEGAITAVAEELGNLLRLKWYDTRLGIDRDHWERVADRPEREKRDDRLQAMIKRGIPAELAENIMKNDRRRVLPMGFLAETPAGKLFSELKEAAGANSGGGGGSTLERHWRGHGDGITMSMNMSGEQRDFHLRIREGVSPYQELTVEDHDRKGLRILFSSTGRQLIFSQGRGGEIQVAHTSDQRNDSFRCLNYDEMARKHGRFTTDLWNMLAQIGCNQPFNKRDRRITKAVLQLTELPDPATNDAMEKAISKYASASLAGRRAARRELETHFPDWYGAILAKLADPKLDQETRELLEQVSAKAKFPPDSPSEFVHQHKLMDDVEYLSGIVIDAPDALRPIVKQRISNLKMRQ